MASPPTSVVTKANTTANGPGLVGDGSASVASGAAATYIMTPKYGDPQAGPDKNKLARFKFSSEFVSQISEGTVHVDKTDPIYKKLAGSGYIEFFLQSIDEAFEERFQIVETLGDKYAVFGIGSKPRIFNFSGALVNSKENEWRINFILMFERYLSISKLARFPSSKVKNVVVLSYDSLILEGAILNLRTNLQASNELATAFSFSMLITDFRQADIIAKTVAATAPVPSSSVQVAPTTVSGGQLKLSGSNQRIALTKTRIA